MQYLYTPKKSLRFFNKQFIKGFFFLFFSLASLSLSATTFNVNIFTDSHAVSPGAGTGLDAAGKISFRSALEAANAVGGTHSVNLLAGTYNLTLGMIVLNDKVENITITGVSNTTIVNMTATLQDRILEIGSSGTQPNMITSISNVQFTGGKLTSDDYGGGAIIAGGPGNSLTLSNCVFQNNSIDPNATIIAPVNCGGAVRYNGGGTLSIDNCTFTGNSAAKNGEGGAVSYFLENLVGAGNGSVSITNSTFTNNTVPGTGGAGGGAIAISAQGRITAGITFSVSVLRNTFTGNAASSGTSGGGAIIIDNGFDVGNTAQVHYNRIVNNTASAGPSGLGQNSAQGNVDATDNWWGCNTGPSAAGTCDKAAIIGSGGAGTLNIASWLQLKATASATPICPGATSVVTESFLTNNLGTAISTANLVRLIGQPISFSSTLGTLSGAQTTIQANGTATVTYTGVTSGSGTVNGVVDNISGSDATAQASIVVKSPGLWLGTSNSSWLNPANWECGILPTATSNVVINSGAPNMPVVDAVGAICNNLTVAAGTSVSFSGNNLLEVRGVLTLPGTFTPTNGSLKLNSASAQILPAGNYYDLFVEGGGAKNPNGIITVSHTLTLTLGSIILVNNDLTINSTGTISGGSATTFIQETGTGRLFQNGIGSTGRTGNVVFPVGTNTASGYTPITVNNTGTTDNFSVRVIDNVYKNYAGETGSTQQASNAVNKTWFINEAVAGGSVAAITFQWNAANELSGFTRASCFASHYSTSLNFWQRLTTQAASGANPYLVTQSNVTAFSPFGIGSAGSVLPLQLISFSGKISDNKIYLDWKTAYESGISKYVIERNNDNNGFLPIGEKAAGNLASESNYNYLDASIEAMRWRTSEYRLKIIDQNGNISYSNVLSFTNSSKKMYVSVVNPFNAQLKVLIDAAEKEKATITLTDISGRQFIKKIIDISIGLNNIPLNTSVLTPGNYILKIGTDKNSFTQKVVKME